MNGKNGGFARGAVRQTAEIQKLAEQRAWLLKMAGVMSEVLQTRDLFVHLEDLRDGRVSLVFNDKQAPLLGESVRNWLGARALDDELADEDEVSETAFVWCEKIDEDYALVGVAGREVVKEEITNARSIAGEIQQALRAVRQSNKNPHIYLHNITPDEVGLDEKKHKNIENLPIALWDALEEDELVQLQPYAKVLSTLSRKRRLIITSSASVVGLLIFGLVTNFYYVQPWLERQRAESAPAVSELDKNIREYRESASMADPALTLATLYKHYAELANRPFVARMEIISLDWEDEEPGFFKIGVAPPEKLDARTREGLLDVAREKITELGYAMSGAGGGFRVSIPVKLPARNERMQRMLFFHQDSDRSARDAVRSRIESWGSDLEAIQFSEGGEALNAVFEIHFFSVQLRNVALDAKLIHALAAPLAHTNANLKSLSFRMNRGMVELGSLNFAEYNKAPAPGERATETVDAG